MDTVSVSVAGQSFRLSRAVLKKHCGYFEQRFGEHSSDKSVELPGVSAETFAVLEIYFTKNELKIMDRSLQDLASLVDLANVLGVTAFQTDLEKTLRTAWSRMTDIHTVFNLASRIGIHSAMVHNLVEDVLKILLGEKEQGSLRECDLSYEILIFAFRLEGFWKNLIARCKYFYSYECFYEAVIKWIVKNSGDETNVVALIDSLRINTVPFKFISDCVANSSGIPDMKELLKIVLQKKHQELVKELQVHLKRLSISSYDGKQGQVFLHTYKEEKFGWEETLSFTRSPLNTVFCAASDRYVYALGDQTLTSFPCQGGAPVMIKYPERLEVNYCFAHSSSLFCFGWNRRDHVLYEFNSERRKFLNHGVIPVDSNFTAAASGDELYVLGEILHSTVKNHQLKVFKYSVKDCQFSWLAILKKTWSQPELTSELDVQEVASNYKAHLVIDNKKMHAFVQEFSPNLASDLYSFTFEVETLNCKEIEPYKHTLPSLFDRHNVLVSLQNTPKGIVMLFRSPYKGDYSLAILDQWKYEIQVLGYLPNFANTHSASLGYILVPQNFPITIYNPADNVVGNKENLLTTEAGSEDTLVKDENDLLALNTSASDEYRFQQRKSDIVDGRGTFVPVDINSRSESRLSSSTSYSYSSRASRRSKKGSKKSIASKAVAIMTSLVR